MDFSNQCDWKYLLDRSKSVSHLPPQRDCADAQALEGRKLDDCDRKSNGRTQMRKIASFASAVLIFAGIKTWRTSNSVPSRNGIYGYTA